MDAFRVLVVCTANSCRSPLVEQLLRAALTEAGVDGVEVSSAGTHAYDDRAMDRRSLAVLTGRGLASRDFRSRALQRRLVETADLVLGAERAHRAAAVELAPRAASRCFTLLELAWLLQEVRPEDLPHGMPERGRALVAAAAGQRGMRYPLPPLDLPDPVGAGQDAFAVCAAQVDAALAPVVALLAPQRRPSAR